MRPHYQHYRNEQDYNEILFKNVCHKKDNLDEIKKLKKFLERPYNQKLFKKKQKIRIDYNIIMNLN